LIDEEVLAEESRKLWEASCTDQITNGDDSWDDKIKLLIQKADREDPANTTKRISKINRPVFKWLAAAVFVAAVSTIVLFVYKNSMIHGKEKLLSGNSVAGDYDRPPGRNVAILTLSNGKKIILDSSNARIIDEGGKTGISMQHGRQLVYESKGSKSRTAVYNTVSTPYGGKFEIVLQDGSRVWLNSLSSIRYPTAFTGPERRVEISGEAYFEISKNAKPFIVEIKQMEVEVLGTHFDVNGYEDEDAIKTTLLEGKVKVRSLRGTNLLKPGQQARLSNNGIMSVVDDVNLNQVIAWKDGVFEFDNADIETIMRQLVRWYGVEVVYKKPVKVHFGGSISRNVNLSKVLHMLEETGNVHFDFEDNKIIVEP